MKKLLCLISLLGCLFYAKAQQDKFYTPYQGLSNTSFNKITQDNEGFIWIATNNGLNKFDGYNFVVYKHDPSNVNSLDLDAVFAIFVDSKGRLWVGTEHGLNLYKRPMDNFYRYPVKYKGKAIHMQITDISEDKKQNIWLTTSVGLIRINTRNNTSYFFNHKFENQELSRDLLNAELFDDNGCLWIGSDKNGLFCYNPYTNRFINYRHNKNSNSLCDNSILSLGKDAHGNIVIGTIKGGISIFNIKSHTFRTISYFHTPGNLFNGGIYSIATDKKGIIWIGTERNGLKILDPVSLTLHDANNVIDLENINDSKIHVFDDSKGNLWFGIDYAGIYLKKQTEKPFFCIKKTNNSSFSISNNIVKSILYDSNHNLWVGTDGGGLNCLPRRGKAFKNFIHNPANLSSLPDNAVISLFEDKKKNIWTGTYLGGLSMFDSKQNSFHTYLIDPLNKGRDFNYVTSIISDYANNLWIATNGGGLQHFDTQTHKFTNYKTIKIKNKTVNLPLFLTTLLLDRNHNLWLGSYYGLYCWNQNTSHYTAYTAANGKIQGDAIFCLFEDVDYKIWFGASSGLFCIDERTQHIKKYTTADGLANNSVYGILKDDKNNLWLSTLNGLSKFNLKTKIFRNYYTYDGLAGNEFRPASCFKGENGTFYFGGTSGLIYFQPDSIRETKGFPTLVFTRFKIFENVVPVGKNSEGRIILKESINETRKINFRHIDNSFTIEFAAIDYNAPEKIRYAYKMEGFDRKWTIKDYSQRFANYTNLNPGTYIFKLKATNSDGIWNNKDREIIIHVQPPFWESWWAYLVYVCLLLLAFLLIRKLMIFRFTMRNNLQIERLEREKLEELNKSKLQFFSNVSHEFRTPLTLIIGPAEHILNSQIDSSLKKQIGYIHRNALRLLRLVNALLDLQKVEKNEMHLKARYGNIVSFAKEITLTFEELSKTKKINLSFHSEIEKINCWFDPDKLDKVIFNLLSNAFKFTYKGGNISVDVSTNNNEAYLPPLNSFVDITVTDTGKGMKEEHLQKIFERFYQIEDENDADIQVGTGLGLHLSKYLVELHHGKLTVSSKDGKGTRFDVLIPRNGDHLSPQEKVSENDIPANSEEKIKIKTSKTDINTEFTSDDETENTRQKYTILVVEDDYDIKSYIKSEFSDQYKIIEASDGIEGWSMAQKQQPELIISDIIMPRMDGIELCKKIKTNILTCHIPVILLTARTSIENRIEGLETGADSYIPKPFHPQHLRIRIEKLIELRQNLMAKFSKSISFEAKEMTITSADERFLQKAMDLVKANISNPNLNIEEMGNELGISRVHLYRKLKALTNQNPSEFVRIIRLKQAAYLLKQNKLNISEVAYAVGFNSHQYFTNCFQNYFGMSPTEYSHKTGENIKH